MAELLSGETMGVWVFTEWREDHLKDISFGLLGEGKRVTDSLSGKLSALVTGEKPAEELKKLFAHGADEVILIGLSSRYLYNLSYTSKIFTDLIKEFQPHLILFGASNFSNEMAGRLSVTCGAGMVTNASRMEIDGKRMIVIKNTYGDRVENRICIHKEVQLVTLKPKELQAIEPDHGHKGNLIRPRIIKGINSDKIEFIDYIPGDPRNLDLRDADFIIAGGKGVGEKESFESLYQLADLMAAVVGGSREAVDRGWIPYPRQIGQTGKTVSPRCLIALGISGAIQFIKGMEDSESVIAVNTDKKAPIFNVADMKILGDLQEIVPALIKYIKQLQSNQVENHSK